MEKFEEHPTWKMLESGMKSLRLLKENTDSAQVSAIAHEAMCALYSLQLALEDQLNDVGSDEQ